MAETKFRKLFHAYLMQEGWLSFPQNSHKSNPGSDYVPGTPDIIGCNPHGVFFGFELKMPGEKLRQSQKVMQVEFKKRRLGEHYRIIRYGDDWKIIVDVLTDCGET